MAGLLQLFDRVTPLVNVVKDGHLLLETAKRENPDLIVVDLSLPNVHGLEAARVLRARMPAIRVLVISLFREPRLAAHVLQAGARGFVLEHSADADLIKAIRAVLAGRRYISPQIAKEVESALATIDATAGEGTFRLTPRQLQVVRLIALGRTVKQAARTLGLSTRTAEAHKYMAMNALKASSTMELVHTAVRLGMLRL